MEERDYLLAYIDDKICLANQKNKIVNSVFYTESEIQRIQKHLDAKKETNYLWTGGFEGAERKVLIVYPSKLTKEMAQKNVNTIVKAIHVQLPRELYGKYQHRDYLASVMKLGLERERFGDMIIFEEEAFLIVLNENASYIMDNLKLLTKFKKAKVEMMDIKDIKTKPITFEEMRVVVASERVDNFIAEIIKCSRSKAEEFLLSERVFVNQKLEMKQSKLLKQGDILTIRGKGKFIIASYLGENKKERKIYLVKKYS